MWWINRLLREARRSVGELTDAGVVNRVERRTDLDGHARPVLLLHGFFTSRRTLDILEARLRRDGYGVFTLSLGGLKRIYNTRGIDDVADYVRAKVERVYARHPNLGPLTIVGHSKGGLVAAYYVKKLGGWRRVRAVVTMGAPFQGTPVAWVAMPMALLAPSAPQLLPGSRFLQRLHEGRWPPQVRLTSIWSRADKVSLWPSPVLDTRNQPQWRNVEVNCFHYDFLTRQRAYAALHRELRSLDGPVGRPALSVVAGGQTG